MTEKSILLDVADRVATVVIAREHRRNALDTATLEEIRETFHEIRRLDVSVVVLTGQGTKAFCAGSDLKAGATLSEREQLYYCHLLLSCLEMIDEFPCATIAAIEGFCLGGGLELALTCDYRVASHESKFGFPEINVGFLPTGGGTVRTPRAIGLARAREMLLFGFEIDAQKALEWALISEVVPAGTSLERAQAMARDYASKVEPASVATLKQILMNGYGNSARAGQTMAYLADYALMQTEPYKRAYREFVNRGKKPPSKA